MVIEFEVEKDGLVFRDALVFPDNEIYTQQEIDAMQKARFDAWYAIVTAPSEE
jgi:hypothetical protein